MMMMSRIGRAHIRKEERESEIERGEERRKIDVTELSLSKLSQFGGEGIVMILLTTTTTTRTKQKVRIIQVYLALYHLFS
jgi:hypothetical protein